MSKGIGDTGGFAEMATFVRSFQISRMISVAASLGIADRLAEAPQPADRLAQECGADPGMFLRLCRALAAFGIFTVDNEDNVAHSDHSRWLRTDAVPTLHYAARYWGMPSTWTTWGELEQAIRTGKAPFEEIFGRPYFDYLKMNPADAEIFESFMRHSPDDRHAAVVEAYDFSGKEVVDVGGGNGALLAAILEANADAKGLLFDQQAVVASAGEVLGKHSDRCKIQSGDFFDSLPAGGDIYTLSQILHDWSDEACLKILSNCKAAMSEAARLLVIERVLEVEPSRSLALNFLSDMHMMMMFPGAKERAPAEFSQLFRQAGFADPRIIPTRSVFCVLETRLLG
ncbi:MULTISPECIES: methyltransferase [unclassified Sinorhizobium]|uniref:methyltransferase n=1 Tax=unclassified Sinorhizobium TaxID=2613772 RepID=UPI003526C0BC